MLDNQAGDQDQPSRQSSFRKSLFVAAGSLAGLAIALAFLTVAPAPKAVATFVPTASEWEAADSQSPDSLMPDSVSPTETQPGDSVSAPSSEPMTRSLVAAPYRSPVLPSYRYTPRASRSSSYSGGTVHVRGHYRKNGSYVQSHTRRSPRRR
ncbi:hypothetical protein Sinac_5087 [Singulisphaera acidiphila DSM 18658]|uniref:Uncharacterized protein n=1 Tax=Singulisphaera acidiphila (strain ATCC BAA-1392 / DSM 18658 / VKM B-2454 / MOB10) TaxID=886293 RepID=L0DIM2_SINAD|nr:hypothetical protein Sinac_5087 [Singulisphaera acidiphila DSM 18658]